MLQFLARAQLFALMKAQRNNFENTVLWLFLSGMGFITANEQDALICCKPSRENVGKYAAQLLTLLRADTAYAQYEGFAQAVIAWSKQPDTEPRQAFIELCQPFVATLPLVQKHYADYARHQSLYPAATMTELERAYHLAADSGHAAAQYVLAMRLYSGNSVAQNVPAAFAYFERALQQSYPLALQQLELCLCGAPGEHQSEYKMVQAFLQDTASKGVGKIQYTYQLAQSYHTKMHKAENKNKLYYAAANYYNLTLEQLFCHGEPQDGNIRLLKVLEEVHACMREYGTSLVQAGIDENKAQQLKDSLQHGVTSVQSVDLDQYPAIGRVAPNTEYVIPDLHGSVEKLLFILQSLGIMRMSEDEFAELKGILAKTTWYQGAQVSKDLPCFFTDKDKKRFEEIIAKIAFGEFHPGSRLIFLGDILGDRGGAPYGQEDVTHSNDYLMLRGLEWLHKRLGAEQFRILFSNHDLTFLHSLDAQPPKDSVAGSGECFSTFTALKRLMASGIITREELDEPLWCYVQHLDLWNHSSCLLGADAPTVYSHAIMGYDLLRLICRAELPEETWKRLDAAEETPDVRITCQRVDAVNAVFRSGLLAAPGAVSVSEKVAHALHYVAEKFNTDRGTCKLGRSTLDLNFFGSGDTQHPLVLLPLWNRDPNFGAVVGAYEWGRFLNGHTDNDTSLDGVANSAGRLPTGPLRLLQLPRPALDPQAQPLRESAQPVDKRLRADTPGKISEAGMFAQGRMRVSVAHRVSVTHEAVSSRIPVAAAQ